MHEPRFKGCTGQVGCHYRAEPVFPGGLRIRFEPRTPLAGSGSTVDAEGLPPIRDGYDINLEPAGEVTLTWRDIFFTQRHSLLGPVWLSKDPSRQSTVAIRSIADDQESLFPATTEARFYWRLEVPRFGWTMVSDEPMVTKSILPHIHRYPIETGWYGVERPAAFSPAPSGPPLVRMLRLDSMRPVAVQPWSEFLHVSADATPQGSGGWRIEFTVDAYRHVPGPRAFDIAWVLWDQHAGGDPLSPHRGIERMRRGRPFVGTIDWTPSEPMAHPPPLELVAITVNPCIPGFSLTGIPLDQAG